MSGNTLKIRCRIESSDENDYKSHKRIAQSFEKCYSSLFNDKVLSDFTIEIKGKQFAVHKTVLAARSSVFRDMFCNVGIDEKNDDKIDLQNIEIEVFEEMLTFVYTGKAPKIEKYANELLIAEDFYDIKDLKTICGQILFKEITDKNVMKALRFADFGLQELEMRAIKFIGNNSDKVAKQALKKR
jgi:speckle-type POZ protein